MAARKSTPPTRARGTSKARGTRNARGATGEVGAAAPVTFDHVRKIAHALPQTEDGTSYGTPALKVRGKLMVRLHQDLDCFVLRTDLLEREMLLQSAPEVFFITEHYRDYPWILVRFATIDRRALPELLESAWRLVAPKSVVAKFDDERSRGASPGR